jgi:hypothetical protein
VTLFPLTTAAAQTERVLRLVTELFGHDALGSYEHGSAVLGGVQPTSDIDILVITGRLATLAEKRGLVEGLMAISAPFPPPGPCISAGSRTNGPVGHPKPAPPPTT